MANMLCRTKENTTPRGKPRVYFTCHPADFDHCFDKVCADIFKTHDCAIYYMEDMLLMIQDQNLDTDLGSNNLFIIPVTQMLLTRPNRAMDVDLPYAQRMHIPVLPIMMEPGLDALYKKSYKFGEIQYLNPYSEDRTEVPYEEKLKNHLETILTNDLMVRRIREAFDGYLFLSYRKKDRNYANALMQKIHSNPECWDVAIWYDEFLTPGESFQDSIQKILYHSKLFVLLVTPNLLEEPDGKPNFVMGQEYPAARTAGIEILPVEMETIDQKILRKKFQEIPDCIHADDETEFWARFLPAIRKITNPDNNQDPEHMFLIGLAYLEGIDVEVDRERGMKLIIAAAEADYPEAMEKLHEIYAATDRTVSERKEAGRWALRLAEYYAKEQGGAHELVLKWMQQLVKDWLTLESEQGTAVLIAQNIYRAKRKLCGVDHPDTLSALSLLIHAHWYCKHPKIAAVMQKELLKFYKNQYGEKDPKTLQAMRDLAEQYGDAAEGNFWGPDKEMLWKQAELYMQLHDLQRQVFGDKHEDTIKTVAELAACHGKLHGGGEKYTELCEKLYDLRKAALGEKHPDTIAAMVGWVDAFGREDDEQKKLTLLTDAYFLLCEVKGEDTPDTYSLLRRACTWLTAWEAMEMDCASLIMELAEKLREYRESSSAYKLFEQAYKIRCRTLGEKDLDTLNALESLASVCYYLLHDSRKALGMYTKLFDLLSEVLGVTDPKTLLALEHTAKCYDECAEHQDALQRFTQLYELQCVAWGEEDERTINTLHSRARIHYGLCNYEIAKKQYEYLYSLSKKVLGEDNYITWDAKERIEACQEELDLGMMPFRKKVCQYCGHPFAGLFRKKCTYCGRRKDY